MSLLSPDMQFKKAAMIKTPLIRPFHGGNTVVSNEKSIAGMALCNQHAKLEATVFTGSIGFWGGVVCTGYIFLYYAI
jgi:hypothetical protein